MLRAKRVRLARPNATPVALETKVEQPGMYALYVTPSSRWNGSGPCSDPSQTPILVKQFSVPESLFANQGGNHSCSKVGAKRNL